MNFTTTTNNTHKTNTISRTKSITTTTNTACAACKFQRRKCESNCLLAPYFPHNRQTQFLNAHRLFGVSKINKIVHKLSQVDKDEAMKSIMFEADVRANDPVGGCYRIVRELQFMIEYCQAELDFVLQQLSVCKVQQTQTHVLLKDQQENDPHLQRNVAFMVSYDSDVDVNANPLGIFSNSPSSIQCHEGTQPQPQHQPHLSVVREDNEDGFVIAHANNNLWVQHVEDENETQVRTRNSDINNDSTMKERFDNNKDVYVDYLTCVDEADKFNKFEISHGEIMLD